MYFFFCKYLLSDSEFWPSDCLYLENCGIGLGVWHTKKSYTMSSDTVWACLFVNDMTNGYILISGWCLSPLYLWISHGTFLREIVFGFKLLVFVSYTFEFWHGPIDQICELHVLGGVHHWEYWDNSLLFSYSWSFKYTLIRSAKNNTLAMWSTTNV